MAVEQIDENKPEQTPDRKVKEQRVHENHVVCEFVVRVKPHAKEVPEGPLARGKCDRLAEQLQRGGLAHPRAVGVPVCKDREKTDAKPEQKRGSQNVRRLVRPYPQEVGDEEREQCREQQTAEEAQLRRPRQRAERAEALGKIEHAGAEQTAENQLEQVLARNALPSAAVEERKDRPHNQRDKHDDGRPRDVGFAEQRERRFVEGEAGKPQPLEKYGYLIHDFSFPPFRVLPAGG